jgi:chloramphenicol 3-O phosphotransferase
VVALNGTSSAGKTSLARVLQERLPDTWLLFGVDTFIPAIPERLEGVPEGWTVQPDGTIAVGDEWHRQYAHWQASVAAFARSGGDVLLDEVLLRGGAGQREWNDVLTDVDVTWVAVHCDLAELERREIVRGDRARHTARWQHSRVHVGVHYDIELDSTATPPDALAAQLVSQLA